MLSDGRSIMPLIARSPKQLGNVIQRTRRQLGLTQTQLANIAGLRQEKVSIIENGQDGAKLSTIFALLAALNLEITVGERSGKLATGIEDIF
jgi:HTH-type transcriptional regulator/antitoxin HipB